MKRTFLFVAMALAGGASGYGLSSLPPVVRLERQLLGRRVFQHSRDAKIARRAGKEAIDETPVQEQLGILQAQLPDGGWENALAMAGIVPDAFVSGLRQHQRELAWIEEQIRDPGKSGPSEFRTYYESHRPSFVFPRRRRARHIFFAAPNESAPELVAQKQREAENVLGRLGQGEKFEAIAAESEDEASRDRGGDLNFFAQDRMLPEIWNALNTQKIGDPAILVRSHLGFHVIQLTDELPRGEISVSAASAEIAGAIENGRRQHAVEAVVQRSE